MTCAFDELVCYNSPRRFQMKLSLTPEIEKLIKHWMKRGGYSSPEAVILSALGALEQLQGFGDFEPGELAKLVKEGEESGEDLDLDDVFAEIRALSKRARTKKAG